MSKERMSDPWVILTEFKKRAEDEKLLQYGKMQCGNHPDVAEACHDTWCRAETILGEIIKKESKRSCQSN